MHVLHQGRRERPDRVALHLNEEIAQRNELLTAKEREILEGHLESEIAAEIQRLLNASADLWTAEDRRVIGAMLQQRIAAEREAAGADGGPANGLGTGTLADQLARALDYRSWHRFRVERWQGGSWRKLSGPASSEETTPHCLSCGGGKKGAEFLTRLQA